jgi:GTP-binding protein HflX
MSDTVGFISNLPTELVAAFRATLEEVLSADLILHVRDIAHSESEAQAKDVTKILESLGINDETPLFEVLNKTDLLEPEDKEAVETQAARSETVFAVSSITGDGLESLLAAVAEALQASAKTEALSLTFAEGRKRAWLFAQGVVEDERQTDEGYTLKVRWTRKQSEQFARL